MALSPWSASAAARLAAAREKVDVRLEPDGDAVVLEIGDDGRCRTTPSGQPRLVRQAEHPEMVKTLPARLESAH